MPGGMPQAACTCTSTYSDNSRQASSSPSRTSFVGGAKLTVVPEAEGRREVAQLSLAQRGRCSK